MTIQTINDYKNKFIISNYSFFTDMGEDTASITLTVMENTWHLHFIRTQSGEPYPLSDTVCNVIDEYEKDLTNEEVFEFLAHHNILKEFEDAVSKL